jgi:HSP20 family protein
MNATNCCATEKQNCATGETVQRQDYVATVDVLETAQDYLLTTDVPGAASDHIDVQYEDGELRIHAPVAPRQKPEQRYLLQEYGVGDYRRSFRVGTDVDATKIEARYTDGVLTVKLPKAEASKPRRVAVNVG